MLCQHKSSNAYFAIKSLKKNEIINRNDIDYLYIEKRILEISTENRYPFLINMFGCFQEDVRMSLKINYNDNQIYIFKYLLIIRSQAYVCFVLEYAAGGDLLRQLSVAEVFEENSVVFYAACVVLGLQYLHENNIIYRLVIILLLL